MGVQEVLGRVGLPAPVSELATRRWDAVVVGGGHNGLTAAAYLARAGRSVLVLERRDRLGGACTLEQPFPDDRYLVSPCAYLVGLLHPLVIAELDLARHGYKVHLAEPSSWCPFEDGTSLAEWKDDGRTAAEVGRISPGDVEGWFAYQDVYRRVRARLRRPDADTWVGDSPDRAHLAELLAGDSEALEVLFELSVAELVERHVKDERLRTALHGAGVIGTWAGPRDPGTAAVRLMHNMGMIGGWGFVEGGMGRVSFAIAEAAAEAGAVLAAGVPVGAVVPGVGVRLEGGELVRAAAVVSNADPRRTLALCEGDVPAAFRRRVEDWSVESPVVKLNCALSRLPTFPAAGGKDHVYRAMVTISTGIDATQAAFDACRRGEVAPDWCELYFQTAHDPSVAPAGRHTMSVFAQYAPYALASGDWDGRRAEVQARILATIARFAPDVAGCVEHAEVLGPPDIEARTGLTGGHIFQGSCLPDQMWERRFASRTPVPGLYLCGAATHPGGSVIGVNGRNAAMAVLADSGRR
jgi:phytoene dehydrogenase-like protein